MNRVHFYKIFLKPEVPQNKIRRIARTTFATSAKQDSILSPNKSNTSILKTLTPDPKPPSIHLISHNHPIKHLSNTRTNKKVGWFL